MTDQIDLPEEPEQPKNTSGFTQMSLATLQNIARADGGFNDLAAYIVLCSGINGRSSHRSSTHGALSISKRAGMTYRAAEKSLAWLQDAGFIEPAPAPEPTRTGKPRPKASFARWIVHDGGLDVAASNQFIDGVKGSQKDSPLKRILAEVDGSDEIMRGRAVMDAIILFAALIKEQDFGDYAGVDPSVLHQKFVPITVEDWASVENNAYLALPVSGVPETNGVLVTVRPVEEQTTTWSFICDSFGGEPDADEASRQEIKERFWWALRQLQKLQLVYGVRVLWQGDPTDPKQRRSAEPLATHFINDAWARKYDPHVQYEINRAVWRTGASPDFGSDGGAPTFAHSNHYRYVVRADREKVCHLVGQYRVRYWAANESTVRGRMIEKKRTEKMNLNLSILGRH